MNQSKPEAAAEITTVALLQRRQGLSDELFSAYWRDVHGVLAARITGFWSYTQNHVKRHGPQAKPALSVEPPIEMDGFAEVCFLSEEDRQGLASGGVTPMILRDEPNVFSRTLLYSLEAGASRTLFGNGMPREQTPIASFVLLLQSPADYSEADLLPVLESGVLAPLKASAGLSSLRLHLLSSGDPTRWKTVEGVDNRMRDEINSVALQVSWRELAQAEAAIESLKEFSHPLLSGPTAYRVTARYEMVLDGRPTMLGLRGLHALQTIEAAGADNQKQEDVIRCVYGESGLGSRLAHKA